MASLEFPYPVFFPSRRRVVLIACALTLLPALSSTKETGSSARADNGKSDKSKSDKSKSDKSKSDKSKSDKSKSDKSKSDKDHSDKSRHEAKGPLSLSLDSVDFATGRAHVLVGGIAKAPDARLFVFHDDKDRHFVALSVTCADATPQDPTKSSGPSNPSSTTSPDAKNTAQDSATTPANSAPAEIPEKVSDNTAPSSESEEGMPEVLVAPEVQDAGGSDGALRCELELPRPYFKAHVLSMTVRIHGRDVPADEAQVESKFTIARAAQTGALTPVAIPMTTVMIPVDDPGFQWFAHHAGAAEKTEQSDD